MIKRHQNALLKKVIDVLMDKISNFLKFFVNSAWQTSRIDILDVIL